MCIPLPWQVKGRGQVLAQSSFCRANITCEELIFFLVPVIKQKGLSRTWSSGSPVLACLADI